MRGRFPPAIRGSSPGGKTGSRDIHCLAEIVRVGLSWTTLSSLPAAAKDRGREQSSRTDRWDECSAHFSTLPNHSRDDEELFDVKWNNIPILKMLAHRVHRTAPIRSDLRSTNRREPGDLRGLESEAARGMKERGTNRTAERRTGRESPALGDRSSALSPWDFYDPRRRAVNTLLDLRGGDRANPAVLRKLMREGKTTYLAARGSDCAGLLSCESPGKPRRLRAEGGPG